MSYYHFFETLKPNSQEKLKILKNMYYKSVLELLFTPLNPWTPFIFLKNIKIAVP